MFSEIVNPTIKLGAKKWWYMPVSIIVHTVLIAAIVIIPLMAVGAVPTPSGMAAFVAAPPPPPPPPPAASAAASAGSRRRSDQGAGAREECEPRVSLHRAVGACAGRRH